MSWEFPRPWEIDDVDEEPHWTLKNDDWWPKLVALRQATQSRSEAAEAVRSRGLTGESYVNRQRLWASARSPPRIKRVWIALRHVCGVANPT
jgi:hypothetical protein